MRLLDKEVKQGDFTRLINNLKKDYLVHYKYYNDEESNQNKLMCMIYKGFNCSKLIFINHNNTLYIDKISCNDKQLNNIIKTYLNTQENFATTIQDEIDNQLGILSFAISIEDDKLRFKANKELTRLHSLIYI